MRKYGGFERVGAAMLGLLFALPAVAQNGGQPSGADIIAEVNALDDGESLSRTMSIEMTDKRGKVREQETVAYRKYLGEEKRSVIFYTDPANIKDTAFLSYDYPAGVQEDDQWLYLPSLRKVRRISASNRGDYYLGTDFTYEDMKQDTRLSAEDYNWKFVSEEQVDGHDCYVVEGTPVDEETMKELGYSEYIAYIDKEIGIARKHELSDINGNDLKTVRFRNIEKVQGIWSVRRMEAENHKTGHSTVLTFDELEYEEEIDDDMFTERALKRGAPRR